MWRLRWLVSFVTQRFNHIARTPDVPGLDALDADDMDGQTSRIDGLSMADDVLVAMKRRIADEAIQDLMRSLYGDLLTTNWIVLADNVVTTDDEDTHVLHPAYSEGMSSWLAGGIMLTGMKYFAGGMS